MEHWQGSVGRSFGPDQGRGAGGASRGTHMYEYESGASSILRTDSEGRRVFGGNNAVSKCNRDSNDIDYEHDAVRTAVVRGLSSRGRKLPKLIGGQVDDIRLFLDSLAKLDDLRECYIRDMIPVFLLQRLCMAAGYTGDTSRISNDDLLDCLHAKAYHKRKLDAISAEESLCSIAQ